MNDVYVTVREEFRKMGMNEADADFETEMKITMMVLVRELNALTIWARRVDRVLTDRPPLKDGCRKI